jgi:hypothetical protein
MEGAVVVLKDSSLGFDRGRLPSAVLGIFVQP